MTAAPAALQHQTTRVVSSCHAGREAGMGGHRRAGPGRGSSTSNAERGAVTAEFAVSLPAVLALLAMLLSVAAAGATQLRIEEGARAGARALARGEDPASVERTVRTLAGGTAAATVATERGWYSITVTDHVGGPLGSSIPWILTARASARSEAPAASAAGGLTDGRGNG